MTLLLDLLDVGSLIDRQRQALMYGPLFDKVRGSIVRRNCIVQPHQVRASAKAEISQYKGAELRVVGHPGRVKKFESCAHSIEAKRLVPHVPH